MLCRAWVWPLCWYFCDDEVTCVNELLLAFDKDSSKLSILTVEGVLEPFGEFLEDIGALIIRSFDVCVGLNKNWTFQLNNKKITMFFFYSYVGVCLVLKIDFGRDSIVGDILFESIFNVTARFAFNTV